jgi:hypothetical protein
MVAGLALATSQPVGHLLDLLGVDRRWPAVFDAFFTLLERRTDTAPKEAGEAWESRLERLNQRIAAGRR